MIEHRFGIGYDIHPKADGRALVLGGVRFESRWGLAGHSDADVLLHAIGDALLGALALGDLGTHFPPDRAEWKDADSFDLLVAIAAMVRENAGSIVHVDGTVIAEAPKIGPKRDAMRKRIADALEIDVSRVSVKATTHEGLGALGRGEGVAALAVATVAVDSR